MEEKQNLDTEGFKISEQDLQNTDKNNNNNNILS